MTKFSCTSFFARERLLRPLLCCESEREKEYDDDKKVRKYTPQTLKVVLHSALL